MRPILKKRLTMNKFLTLIASLFFTLGMLAETQFTFTSAADMSQTKDGITVVIAAGGGNAPLFTADYETGKPEMRLYTKNTITVSSSTALTNIQLVFAKSSASNKQYAGLTAGTGTLVSGGVSEAKDDWKVDSWTGSANSVVFTLSGTGQRQIRLVVIDGDPVVIGPDEDPLPTEDDLDWSYFYQEPEIVPVPETQLFQKEYAFIENNILVHCTKGSIVKASEDEDAYFGCQAGEKLTFSATQYIKGIAIKGNVRKAFTATSSRGDISYCSDPDQETAADPVLVVRNINSMSVTINCDKNLSCYEVKVYFEENPSIACEEINVPGETYFLNYDTASVELDTDESKTGDYVYTLYLWNKINEWIYMGLDIHTPAKNTFAGMYSTDSGNMTTQSFIQYGEEYDEYTYATEGQMVINQNGNIFSISGYITCEDKNTYNFSYTGLLGGDNEVQGLEKVQRDKVQSTKILREGQLYLMYDGKMYDVQGKVVME